MQTIRGNFGKVQFCDCLEYLHSLHDQSRDLAFLDPPWGHDYNGKRPMGINAQAEHDHVENYNDSFDPDWNLKWFHEIMRVHRRVVIAMGWRHFNWWVATTNPRGYHFLCFKNGQGSTRVTKHNAMHPLLCYGEGFNNWDAKFHWNFTPSHLDADTFYCVYMQTYIRNGFLRMEEHKYTHGSPKPAEDWADMIQELNPTDIADYFAGTCCIGEVGEWLGIPWDATELRAECYDDCDYRIHKGMLRNKQTRKQLTLI